MYGGDGFDSSSSDDDATTPMMFAVILMAFSYLKMAQNKNKRQRKSPVFRRPCRECAWATMLRNESFSSFTRCFRLFKATLSSIATFSPVIAMDASSS